MADNIKNKFGIQRTRNYLNRDFSDFRLDLLKYANTYFKDKIQDFSEASLGGLFLDMAAYVGDNMSFYLDHQFRELNPNTAVEAKNIESMVRNAGIKISGNSPASVTVDFYIEVPANDYVVDGVEPAPLDEYLPKVKDGAIILSESGIEFHLTEELDFSLKNTSGTSYIADTTAISNSAGVITSYVFKLPGLCVSGQAITQTVAVGSTFIPYRTITLDKPHVTAILRVYDSEGNDYYEVESLAQDTVFRKNKLTNGDTSVEVLAAPFRYITSTSTKNRSTTLRFGSGDGSNINTDVTPDPSEMAIPLYGKTSFSSFSLDPNQLLQNPSLGISPVNTTIKIIYRHGGGANHNVEAESISQLSQIEWVFMKSLTYATVQNVKNSLAVSNPKAATGGSRAPSVTELRNFVVAGRSMQNRVVTTQDLLARIYTMPTDFGIVYRANVIPNPENALSSILYICSRDKSGALTQASDALKQNISTYINEFRLIGDAMDILDADIINFQINITCRFAHNVNKYELVSLIIRKVKALYTINQVALGKPIIKSEILAEIIRQPGVISVVDVYLSNISGTEDGREYSTTSKNLDLIYEDDMYFAEPYEIFELRHPSSDVNVTVL